MGRRFLTSGAVLATGAMLLGAGCGSSSTSSSKAASGSQSTKASKTPITLGFIYSATGGASSSYINSEWGAEARVDAQNAAGGVNGHPIKLSIQDDTSSAAGNLTAAQNLVENQHVFGIIDDSSFTFGASKYLTQQGVPVTGAAIDGPEWGEATSTNMFTVSPPSYTPVDGKYYAYNYAAHMMKDIGITKLAGVVYNIESAIQSMSSTFQTGAPLGISKCYVNNSVAFGATDFTSEALAIKSLGCDGVTGVSLLATDIAVAGAIKNSGINAKQIYPTSYDQNLLDEPSALATMVGTYAYSPSNFTNPNAAASTMLSRLKQYTGFKGGIPSLNILYGYVSADLMIEGLQMAGANPTRAAFISKLRTVGNYSADGLIANPVTFQGLGTAKMFLKTGCEYLFEVQANGYSSYNSGKPICGDLIATSAS